MDKLRYACIMIGGFLGPFAAQSLAVVLPEFAGDFEISLGLAALTMTAYSLPFASTMLISSYLVRGISPTQVVRVAYIVIAVVSVVLVFSPKWWLFLIAFTIAGIANAFTTPILQLILKHITPDEKLGQALGAYAAMQSFGLFSAPLISGLTSLVTWRLNYVMLGLFALLIVLVRVPLVPHDDSRAPSQRIITGGHVRAMFTLFAVGSGVIGMSFVVSLLVGERFDAGPVTRGAIVMVGGLTAFLFARILGHWADTFGPRPVLIGGLLVGGVALLAVAMAPTMWLLAVAWGLAVLAVQGTQIAVNLLVLRAPGGSTMVSTVQAFRFFGNAATPLVFLPIYHQSHLGGFAAAAGGLFIMALVNVVATRVAKSHN
ncbi:MFS transporter [Corynebacterium breve]|uniref:MFS transporter n=1 Tax=Corynebacterium breve TaxID=3049799 RepID=A0ABY8VIB2_9CORY|nr:MFS transporter [Corynebacterium breve]WIM68485.1 MFS transporter [Corynebacterium breve]